MPQQFVVTAIGHVRSPVKEPLDDVWGGLVSQIEVDPASFSPDALRGLEEYSHVEIIFLLDRMDENAVIKGSRRPRGRTDWPEVGIFAQRAKNRPNRIAVTVCKLLKVEGLALTVESLDAIEGTPVLDIKPYLAEFAPKGRVRQPQWSRELMAGYWKKQQ